MRISNTVLLWLVIMQQFTAADESLGSLDMAFFMVSQREFMTELDLQPEDQIEFLALGRESRRSTDFKHLREKKREASRVLLNAQPGDRLAFFIENTNDINEINDSILGKVDAVLNSNTKSKRFRELLAQAYLRFGQYESFLRTLKWEPDEKEYAVLFDGFAEFSSTAQNARSRARFDAAVRLLDETGLMPKEKSLVVAGVWLEKELPDPSPSTFMGVEHDKYVAQLLRVPAIAAELQLSPRRTVQVTKIGKNVEIRATSQEAKADTKPADFRKARTAIAVETEVELDKVLTDDQRQRLNEILFQKYLSSFQLSAAMVVSKRKVSADERKRLPNSTGLLNAEADFNLKADQINKAVGLVTQAFGKTKTKRALGKLVLPESPARKTEKNKEDYYELYRTASAKLSFGQNGAARTNRRREDPSN